MEDHKDHAAALERASLFRNAGRTDGELRSLVKSTFPDYAKAREEAGLDVLPWAEGPKVQSAPAVNANPVRETGVTINRPAFNGVKAATYRFIPPITGGKIVPAPGEVQEEAPEAGYCIRPINDPLPNGYCATIDVQWEAETPLLIGSGSDRRKKAVAEVDGVRSREPITHLVSACLKDNGNPEWILPGSTLRGLMRNAVETLSFSRMTQFNRNRFFSLREFQHTQYGYGTYPLLQREKMRCGWIKMKAGTKADYKKPAGLELEILQMQHDDWEEILASDLVRQTNYKRGGDAFIVEKLNKRLEELGITPDKGVYDFFAANPIQAGGGKKPMLPLLTYEVPKDKSGKPASQIHQYLIAKPTNHKEQNAWQPLAPKAVEQFIEIHSTRVDEKLTPKGHLDFYWRTLVAGKPVPIFFVGDAPRSDNELEQSKFAMGLTRLFRVPHLYDFRSAVERAYGPSMPRYDAETGKRLSPLDINEALFGFVYEEIDLVTNNEAKPIQTPAQKGRIAFGHARLSDNTPAIIMEPVVATMGQPQPSFAPYYLAGKWKDYSPPAGQAPKVAGRKTYLPRYNASVRQSPEQMVRHAARETILEFRDTGKPDADKYNTWSALKFLSPADANKKLRFSGQIRLHNVVREEIGAILWALTHGGANEAHRHMVGHAKGLGAGQMRVAKVQLNVAANDGSRIASDDAVENYLQAYEKYMDRFIADWRRHQVVTTWLAASRPENGAKLAQQGKLQSMKLKKYGELRKQTAPMIDTKGNRFAQPDDRPLIKIED
ncbi:MAG: TIGR03986 family CRISPR-associated RAMP protein [Ahrensia sp.]